jgi:hypothetical protein
VPYIIYTFTTIAFYVFDFFFSFHHYIVENIAVLNLELIIVRGMQMHPKYRDIQAILDTQIT